jgi:hypothetical protein
LVDEVDPKSKSRPWNPEWNDQTYGFREIFSIRARFKGLYLDSPERLDLLECAASYSESYSIDDWKFNATQYPKIKLELEEFTKADNPDLPVRAFYLERAMKNLLILIGAPPTMIADVSLLLSEHAPAGANKYAEVQEAMIDNIGATVPEISNQTGANPSTIYDLIRRKIVIRPK